MTARGVHSDKRPGRSQKLFSWKVGATLAQDKIGPVHFQGQADACRLCGNIKASRYNTDPTCTGTMDATCPIPIRKLFLSHRGFSVTPNKPLARLG